MSDGVDVLDPTVRHQQTILGVDVDTLPLAMPVLRLLYESPIDRMNSLAYQLRTGRGRHIIFKNATSFLRPRQLSGCNLPVHAARVAESLHFDQVGLALSQLLFCLRALHGDARELGDPVDDIMLLRAGAARFAIVGREGPQDRSCR